MKTNKRLFSFSGINAGDRFTSLFFNGVACVRSVEKDIAVMDFEDKGECRRNVEQWRISDMIAEIACFQLKHVTGLFYRKRKESGEYSDWEILPENFESFDFAELFLPDYHRRTDVDLSFGLSSVLSREKSLKWFRDCYPEFKNYSLAEVKKVNTQLEKQIFHEAICRFRKQTKNKEVIVCEFPVRNTDIELVCHLFRRNKVQSSYTRSENVWENMPEFKTWDFVEQFLPNYDHDTGVTYSNDLACIVDGSWTREKFDDYYPEYKDYSLKKLRKELKELDEELYERSSEYFNQALSSGDIDLKEIPIGITSSRICEGTNVCLWTIKDNEETEISVHQMKLQRVYCRVLDDNNEDMQVLYTDESGKSRWMYGQSIDFD